MYSLEDRMKAVQLYIDTGCNGAEVIRSLGYPSPKLVRCSPEQKQAAVESWFRSNSQCCSGAWHLAEWAALIHRLNVLRFG